MIRDRKYLDALRFERCILTGAYGNENEAVEAAHIGTAGRGVKSPDNEALPMLHSLHVRCHQKGEVSTLRELAPDWLIREAFRAYARELYAAWKK